MGWGGGLLETFSHFPFLEVVLCKVKAQDPEIKVRMLWPVDMEEKESISQTVPAVNTTETKTQYTLESMCALSHSQGVC